MTSGLDHRELLFYKLQRLSTSLIVLKVKIISGSVFVYDAMCQGVRLHEVQASGKRIIIIRRRIKCTDQCVRPLYVASI